jgi:predicted GNAT family acetyltransferase
MSIDVQHDPNEKKYYATVDGHEGHVTYSEGQNGKRIFHHTYVAPELRGQGVAEAIVRHALDETRREGHRYAATCPFVSKFIERHPEYKDQGG